MAEPAVTHNMRYEFHQKWNEKIATELVFCPLCGHPIRSTTDYNLDHIIPVSVLKQTNKPDLPEYWQAAHPECNRIRGNARLKISIYTSTEYSVWVYRYKTGNKPIFNHKIKFTHYLKTGNTLVETCVSEHGAYKGKCETTSTLYSLHGEVIDTDNKKVKYYNNRHKKPHRRNVARMRGA